MRERAAKGWGATKQQQSMNLTSLFNQTNQTNSFFGLVFDEREKRISEWEIRLNGGHSTIIEVKKEI